MMLYVTLASSRAAHVSARGQMASLYVTCSTRDPLTLCSILLTDGENWASDKREVCPSRAWGADGGITQSLTPSLLLLARNHVAVSLNSCKENGSIFSGWRSPDYQVRKGW